MHAGILPGKNGLRRIRAKALRQGIWFKVLTRAERAQMELTMSIVKRIRSHFLANVVIAIAKKLWNAMESKVARLMGDVGQVLARRLSRIAQRWGNKSSCYWEADLSFVQYLAVSHMNTPAIFKL